jgi:predicted DNA-binding transcriptional regulator AlpA
MDKYLRVKGVAEMLSVSTSTVWNYVKQDTNFPKSKVTLQIVRCRP